MTHANRHDSIRPIQWSDGQFWLLDQRLLPHEETYIAIADVGEVYEAIHSMVVRGAPAIGITAAYGVALSARQHYPKNRRTWLANVEKDVERLRHARPTAVNLSWALDRMLAAACEQTEDPRQPLLAMAHAICEDDVANNRAMGDIGAALMGPGSRVLTHCNAGALATGGYGTALGVIRSGYAQGKVESVFADETRPWLQGARLTAWELVKENIPVTLIADGAANHVIQTQGVSWVIVGADRVAANGDVANKIGTLGLAIAARYHHAKMMVVAPTSTIDRTIASGDQIPIESRDQTELLAVNGTRVAAPGAVASNPVFDVTPADLVDVLVTEKGAISSPNTTTIAALFDVP